MSGPAEPRTIVIYKDNNDKEPFTEWLHKLRDPQARLAVTRRIDQLSYGLYGNWRSVGASVYELKLSTGPGYRIYFGERENRLVILLCAGDKSSQNRDILRAKQYWKEYKRHVRSK